ncbi:hypothetical protein SCHPADRAFT_901759 [Schizopora paradoxa]|uniref:Uncharacterized protein n=1 Tax=Schizopora paradoxa TaxID=27342 RepID=A0A0H2S383_9AGAM|nr:hypothetical protein SCHPADRAFT_901759 [Schizopora paradoxa]
MMSSDLAIKPANGRGRKTESLVRRVKRKFSVLLMLKGRSQSPKIDIEVQEAKREKKEVDPWRSGGGDERDTLCIIQLKEDRSPPKPPDVVELRNCGRKFADRPLQRSSKGQVFVLECSLPPFFVDPHTHSKGESETGTALALASCPFSGVQRRQERVTTSQDAVENQILILCHWRKEIFGVRALDPSVSD